MSDATSAQRCYSRPPHFDFLEPAQPSVPIRTSFHSCSSVDACLRINTPLGLDPPSYTRQVLAFQT